MIVEILNIEDEISNNLTMVQSFFTPETLRHNLLMSNIKFNSLVLGNNHESVNEKLKYNYRMYKNEYAKRYHIVVNNALEKEYTIDGKIVSIKKLEYLFNNILIATESIADIDSFSFLSELENKKKIKIRKSTLIQHIHLGGCSYLPKVIKTYGNKNLILSILDGDVLTDDIKESKTKDEYIKNLFSKKKETVDFKENVKLIILNCRDIEHAVPIEILENYQPPQKQFQWCQMKELRDRDFNEFCKKKFDKNTIGQNGIKIDKVIEYINKNEIDLSQINLHPKTMQLTADIREVLMDFCETSQR